jgi:hypothetical protein
MLAAALEIIVATAIIAFATFSTFMLLRMIGAA